jgi:3-deoxy-D-manno-octulosonic-acid transferase
MLILMETELWPNLLAQCSKNDIPVLIANARISSRSARRYALVPGVTRTMLAAIDCFAVQGQNDMKRFVELGANAQRVVVTGSLKFDVDLPPSTSESGQALRRLLGVSRPVWMAGSTRDGEEELVLQALADLKKQHPDLLLVLAPRHPHRFDGAADLVAKRGFVCVRHSQKLACSTAVDVYLLDSMGELPNFYAASDIAFVGGSLVPQGGHNVLEPAALGRPVVVGPHTYNFTDIVAMLGGVGALVAVADVEELAFQVDDWVRHVEKRDTAGAAGRLIVQQNRGSVGKVVKVIEEVLDRRAPPATPGQHVSRIST